LPPPVLAVLTLTIFGGGWARVTRSRPPDLPDRSSEHRESALQACGQRQGRAPHTVPRIVNSVPTSDRAN
jgi:hypothetical protein